VRHRSGFCRNWPVPGKERCRLHGGLSTDPLTDKGKARSLAAIRARRQRSHEECGRRKLLARSTGSPAVGSPAHDG
jgi:hypothetical protein